ncbi:tyrosine-type recombinase/integrase [Methylobacterium nodulans]|uniref:Integrase family protein n=1 Tax=Methylobacterium nodulans (strain LMG 21967 / CNCM I-2342 / ORS 2060) TaxID=460265 RepID=B8ICS8_METNO|nr:tyrosine-type recombinase/integrase [Methylobacterium nodulans]ACL57489.1 integrase family protein [Methylobacterium nodulans ORS 2060]
MPRERPPHLVREITRHGKPVWYVRVGQGKRIRMRETYGSPEFWRDYRLAVESGQLPAKQAGPNPGTLSWLIARYVASPEWADLSRRTRTGRHAILRAVEKTAGNELLRHIDRKAIVTGRDRRRDTPSAANNFLYAMRALFAWAVEHEHIDQNPAVGVKPLARKNADVGFHTWTEEEVRQFEARWPVGTQERLALDLLLYTGLRRSDVVVLGRQHVKGDTFTIRTKKTGAVVVRPILPPLAASIAAAPTGDLAFLVTSRGTPWVDDSFAKWFRRACEKAGVPGRSHGLRKAAARRAAEAGASEMELNALFGWRPGSRESATYTRAADVERLARGALMRNPRAWKGDD